MEKKLSMIILAGGQSRRMGTDKADLIWQGKTFLQLQIEKGQALGIEDIQVSGYRGTRCPIPITPDRFPEKGPLAGLEACLRRAKHPRCLVLSVDMPFVPVQELSLLIQENSSHPSPVTILKADGREQPLVGIYATSQADTMAEEITNHKGSVFAFLGRVGYCVYESPLDGHWAANINYPEQYQSIFHETAQN